MPRKCTIQNTQEKIYYVFNKIYLTIILVNLINNFISVYD